MKNNSRKIFLDREWRPYPDLNSLNLTAENSWRNIFGRVSFLSENCIRLTQEDKIVSIDIKSSLSLGFISDSKFIKQIPALEVLRLKDIVCFLQDGDNIMGVILLAPSKESSDVSFQTKLSFENSRRWSNFLQKIRSFFIDKGFCEVTTPSLVESPAVEPYLHSFQTFLETGNKKKRLYLPTSPELHLKKMLSLGWEKIYEIKTCFRNEEVSKVHQPEFSMLEWYRSYSGLEEIVEDVEELFSYFLEEKIIIQRYSFVDVFKKLFQFELTPHTSAGELKVLLKKESLYFNQDEKFDSLFTRLLIDRIELFLQKEGIVILYDYPPSQSALARINSEGWADRFEVYWNGLEIANAFHELNDPIEQQKRIEQSNMVRVKEGRAPHSIDKEFMNALYLGMPPAGGIALGLDRLFMSIYNIKRISETRGFPINFKD